MKDFKPHWMYDPKTGEKHRARTPADHNKMSKMGYTHEKPSKKETYSPQKHEWGTDASVKYAKQMTPGEQSEHTEKPMKTFSDIYERVKSADKKPQKYKDDQGRERVRMVSTDQDIVKESHFKVGQKVKCKASGMTGKVVKVDPEEKGKYYTVRQDSGKVMKYAPDELSAVTKEEVEVQETKMPESQVRANLQRYGYSKRNLPHLAQRLTKIHKKKHVVKGDSIHVQEVTTENGDMSIDEMNNFAYRDMSDTGGDEEVQMAVRQLHFIEYAAQEIMEYVEMRGDLDEWFQNKLANAHMKMQGLHSYIEGDKRAMGMDESVEGTRILSEPATSKAQQQAAGAALAAKRGDVDPSTLKGASKDMYDSMSKKELEDFASTKHKGLPTRKEGASRAPRGSVSLHKAGQRAIANIKKAAAEREKASNDKSPAELMRSLKKSKVKEENELGVLIPMEYDENNNLVPKQEGSALWDILKKMENNED